MEDIELGSRLLQAGYSIRLDKDLQVKHLKQWRLGDMLATDLFRRAAPWTELMLREGRMVNDLNVGTRNRFSVFLACLALLFLPASVIWPPLLAVAAVTLILVGVVNADFFRFLLHRRGLLFTLGAIPLYGAYLVVCGLGFTLGLFQHLSSRITRRER
jgi:hypothetical protein